VIKTKFDSALCDYVEALNPKYGIRDAERVLRRQIIEKHQSI
jgi:hypothetical protein